MDCLPLGAAGDAVGVAAPIEDSSSSCNTSIRGASSPEACAVEVISSAPEEGNGDKAAAAAATAEEAGPAAGGAAAAAVEAATAAAAAAKGDAAPLGAGGSIPIRQSSATATTVQEQPCSSPSAQLASPNQGCGSSGSNEQDEAMSAGYALLLQPINPAVLQPLQPPGGGPAPLRAATYPPAPPNLCSLSAAASRRMLQPNAAATAGGPCPSSQLPQRVAFPDASADLDSHTFISLDDTGSMPHGTLPSRTCA